MKIRQVLVLFVLAVLARPWFVEGQVLTATLTAPSDGATNVSPAQTMQWTSVLSAQKYVLWVGTTPGANDVVNTPEVLQTSYQPATLLLPNQTLYARMWTKSGDVWRFVDSTFTTGSVTATLTSPANGASNISPLQAMQWTSVPNAQDYELYLGTSAGATNVFDTGRTQLTSYQPAAVLPAGQTLYARMWTKVGGVWRSVDSTFTAASLTATLTSPANGATGVSPLQAMQWASVPNGQAYELYLGTSAGSANVFDTGQTQLTSYQPTVTLPSNQTLYARMWTKVGGNWRSVDSTFTTGSLTATLTSPVNGATDVSPVQALQWTTVANAQAYELYLGTSVGGTNVFDSGQTQLTSYQPTVTLPANQTLYARMWTKVGGTWRSVDSTFMTGSLTATLTSPVNGATGVSPVQAIQWTTVTNAQKYVLWLGTSAGASNVVNTPEITQTSYQPASLLPASQTLYARMWTKVGGVWRSVDSTFTTGSLTATLTTPASGATSVNPLLPMQWTGVAGAQAYVLWVGTSAASSNVVNTPETQATSYQPSSLPANQTLYARLWTKMGNVWRSTDSTFSAASLIAQLTYPVNGASNVDDSVAATWGAVQGADRYVLHVGTSLGANNLLGGSVETVNTWYPIAGLPPNQLMHARLWTRAGGVWRFSDSTFTVSAIAPLFSDPLDGATAVSPSQPFTWTTARNAQAYKLSVGTSAGANDVFETEELAGTSYLASGLSTPGPLYARVWAKVNGQWTRHTDIGFTLDATVPPSMIDIPFDGEPGFASGRPFQWTTVPLARGYRLSIGTTLGGSDLHDSGEIHVTTRFVQGLPTGTLLFGRLQTKIAGQWSTTDFTFTVSDNAPSATLQIKSALWVTDVVRTMAFDADSRPLGGTKLWDQVFPRYGALCTDFAATLLQMLGEMNVTLQSRRLDIAFDTNGFDQHTLVELLDPDSGDWILLDPTFDLTVTRLNGTFATADDVSQATRTSNWTGVTYEFFGTAGNLYASSYYLDYPLLYLNIAEPFVWGVGESPLPYLDEMTLPVTGAPQPYKVRCSGSPTTQIVLEGNLTEVACPGIDLLSAAFFASSVAAPPGGPASFQLYRLHRFVF